MGSIPHHTSVGSDRQAGMNPEVSSSGREPITQWLGVMVQLALLACRPGTESLGLDKYKLTHTLVPYQKDRVP